jgi:pilus assembly protein Flp/PilA
MVLDIGVALVGCRETTLESSLPTLRCEGRSAAEGGFQRIQNLHDSLTMQTTEGTTMRQLLHSVNTFLKSEDGPTSVEYCVIMAFIFLVCFAAIGQLGETTHGLYSTSLGAIE